MLTLENVREFVYENLNNVSSDGVNFHARCPLCGDSKKSKIKRRFHIQYLENNCRYHCFNCNSKGDFYKLYSIIKGIDRKEVFRKYNTFNSNELKKRLGKKEVIVKKIIKRKNFNWILKKCLTVNDKPDGFIQKKMSKSLKSFIKKRHININIFICYEGDYRERIIIPIYENDDIIYFQARSLYKNSSTKYLNPVVEKSGIIFNKDNFNREKDIYITEGILDAQSIGYQGTTCLGKTITDDFLKTLKTFTDKKLVIVLDNDKDGLKNLSEIMKNSIYKNSLKYFLMPNTNIKDINEYKMKNSKNNIYEFLEKNSYSLEKAYLKMTLTKKKG